MGSLSEGEHWLRMRKWSIKRLTPVASDQAFGRGEEMARSLLRNKLRDERIAKAFPSLFSRIWCSLNG